MFNVNTSNPSLTNVKFLNNSAYSGGGMHNNSSSPSLTKVTFFANSASYIGGGMYNGGGSPTLANVTFSSNSSASLGGGMGNFSSSAPTLTNVTFSGNSTDLYGGGGMYSYESTPILKNTIIADSVSGGDCVISPGALDPTSSNNLIEDASNACELSNGVNGNIIGSDPKLMPLADNGGFRDQSCH